MTPEHHLGEPRPVVEQLARQVPQLAEQVLGRHGGRIERRLVKAEVGDDDGEVGVGGQGPEVAQCRQLEQRVVEGAGHK